MTVSIEFHEWKETRTSDWMRIGQGQRSDEYASFFSFFLSFLLPRPDTCYFSITSLFLVDAYNSEKNERQCSTRSSELQKYLSTHDVSCLSSGPFTLPEWSLFIIEWQENHSVVDYTIELQLPWSNKGIRQTLNDREREGEDRNVVTSIASIQFDTTSARVCTSEIRHFVAFMVRMRARRENFFSFDEKNWKRYFAYRKRNFHISFMLHI